MLLLAFLFSNILLHVSLSPLGYWTQVHSENVYGNTILLQQKNFFIGNGFLSILFKITFKKKEELCLDLFCYKNNIYSRVSSLICIREHHPSQKKNIVTLLFLYNVTLKFFELNSKFSLMV